MKKVCTLAGVLILVGLVGRVLGDETILPAFPFTNVIVERVVEGIAEYLPESPSDWSLLQRASNKYRDAVYGVVKGELPHGSDDSKIEAVSDKELTGVRERLIAGPMLLVPFWQGRFVLEIEQRGIGKALIPKLEQELLYLRGETTAKLRALQRRAELRRAALGTDEVVLAKGGTKAEAQEKTNKAWGVLDAHVESSGISAGDIKSFEWIERRKKETGGKVILAVLAHGVGKILNELKALEAERARLPKMESPAVMADSPAAQPSAAAAGTSRSPFRR